MSEYFRPTKKFKITDLAKVNAKLEGEKKEPIDIRLGVGEENILLRYNKESKTTNYLHFYMNKHNKITDITRYGLNNESSILEPIEEILDTHFVSEYDKYYKHC